MKENLSTSTDSSILTGSNSVSSLQKDADKSGIAQSYDELDEGLCGKLRTWLAVLQEVESKIKIISEAITNLAKSNLNIEEEAVETHLEAKTAFSSIDLLTFHTYELYRFGAVAKFSPPEDSLEELRGLAEDVLCQKLSDLLNQLLAIEQIMIEQQKLLATQLTPEVLIVSSAATSEAGVSEQDVPSCSLKI